MPHHAGMTRPVPPLKKARIVIGTMTGTSLDGDIDVAAVRVNEHGAALRVQFLAGVSHSLGNLVDNLRRAAEQCSMSAREFAGLSQHFGQAHATAIQSLCAREGLTPDLIVLHGQTVFHAPPLSWQLINPWPVACSLQCRVRFDLRAANLASGGEGAPITPLADHFLFGGRAKQTAVLNLGGFANATLLAPDTPRALAPSLPRVRGFDVCACNHLLNRVARDRLGRNFDENGNAALAGACNETALDAMLRAMRAPPQAGISARRSLGTGDESARTVQMTAHLSPQDACRTVTEAVARLILSTLREAGLRDEDTLLLAGGSTRHQALVRAMQCARVGTTTDTMDSHGVPVGMREAAGMAVLGALADDGVSYCVEEIVGRRSRVLDSACIDALQLPDQAEPVQP